MNKKIIFSVLLLMPFWSLAQNAGLSKTMEKQLSKIESLIPLRDSINLDISKSDVAWHLDHMLKVLNKVYGALASSNPAEYRAQWSITRGFVFLWGDFPRGIAKSPEVVLPPEEISTDSLYSQLAEARKKMAQIDLLPAKSHFYHFSFKRLNRNKTARFLEVHTNHHLKIIRDILRKN